MRGSVLDLGVLFFLVRIRAFIEDGLFGCFLGVVKSRRNQPVYFGPACEGILFTNDRWSETSIV